MTTKERNLSYVLGGALGVIAVGFIAHQFILSPMWEKDKLIAERQNEVDELNAKAQKIQRAKLAFEFDRQQSLPQDVKFSRGQYTILLDSLARKADFASGAFKVSSAEPDEKTAPIISAKKRAYTRLTFDISVRADLWRVTDFLRRFYEQPLLHTVKKINVQRPSDAKAQQRQELDVTLTIEALVLDVAPDRPTLLPTSPALALMSGTAAQVGYNMNAVLSGTGSPFVASNVLATEGREYLRIAGKNPFYGPYVPTKERITETPAEEDASGFITLTSVLLHPEDGSLVATFRDKTTNNNYTITQKTDGSINVMGEYELVPGKKKPLSGYSSTKPNKEIIYGTEEGQNKRVWRVRRVLDTLAVIVERIDPVTDETPVPKPMPLALLGGGPGAFVTVPEGKVFRVAMGQSLIPSNDRDYKSPAPAKPYLLSREAWREVFYRLSPTPALTEKPPIGPVENTVSIDRGR